MRPGRYAAPDGSFAKSAGGAGLRGLALLAIALLLGIVLLNATDADPPGSTVAARGDSDTADDGGDGDASGETPAGGGAAVTTPSAPTTTAVPARAPKDVKVIVANGSPTKGAAGNASNALKPAGYNVLSPTNAPASDASSVFFTPGYDQDAKAVATLLKLPPTAVQPMPVPPPFPTNTANVAVVIGAADAAAFGSTPTTAGAGAGAAGSSGATTTTASSSASSSSSSTTKKP